MAEPDLAAGAGREVLRRASVADATVLRDLERATNLVALGHVFAAGTHPFPDEDVRRRWVTALGEPQVVAWLAVDQGGPGAQDTDVGFVAHDDGWIRHLGVRPDRWGAGLGARLLAVATAAVEASGATPRLWCPARNERALGLYLRRGWRPAGEERRALWPPHPREIELSLAGSGT